MATSLSDLAAVVAAQHESGRTYMMMETAVYTRQFLYAQEPGRRGDFGRIQPFRPTTRTWNCGRRIGMGFLLCGTPRTPSRPVSPSPRRGPGSGFTALGRVRCVRSCDGSMGKLPIRSRQRFSSSRLPGLAAEVTRSLFHCARY